MTDRAPGCEPSGRTTALITLGLALLVCARMPEIIIKGRFWAEDGAVFFPRAWVMPPWHAIWRSYGGYLNLVANTATVAARWILPLRYAPYLSIGVGLFFQLVPPILLLTARDVWLRAIRVRLVAVLLIVLIPGSEEIWLQDLSSQVELTLACGIILALDTCGGWMAAFRLGILLLAPLSGPGVIALVPLFLLRAATDRSPARLAQLLILGAGAGVQLLGFFAAVHGRTYETHPTILLATVTVRHLALPFLGTAHGEDIAVVLRNMIQRGERPWIAVLLPIVISVGLLVVSFRAGIRRPPVWLLAGGVLTAGISYYGAIQGGVAMIDVQPGGRYVYAPQALFLLCIVALAATSDRKISILAWSVSVWLLVISASEFFFTWDMIADGPAWRPQVAAWHADPNHVLQIWPSGWKVRLPPPTKQLR